ncbi:hypothetical protein FPOA_11709 [Fusarium poae]|uniref:Mg2+ transporter zinc transport protein n=1 Tax=Fusarium poae TaxID=36050 RepID=A0A1B8AHZ6_FUSPO|nr:hypothetical protein FPOA_11709 [Fusarium poae]
MFVDNRWPVFTMGDDGRGAQIQYYICDGVIYQTFLFLGSQPLLSLEADLMIRQLEFSKGNNQFNRDEKHDEGYHTELSSNRHDIKRWHDFEGEDKHIALFISAHMGESALSFTKNGQKSEGNDCDVFCIVWPKDMNSGAAKITFAYSLELSKDASIKSPSKTANIPIPWDLIKKQVFKDPDFTELPRLNRLLIRNLEHILSVCSIPVHANINGDGDPAIALTCGDIDDHRVAIAASFYCFQLLLMALKHFESLPKHSAGKCADAETCYSCFMAQRIRKVLKGHLKWIFAKEYRDLAGNARCTHTWVNGEEIAGWENSPYFPISLVGVPFQLIMAGDFYEYEKSYRVDQITGEARTVHDAAGEAWRVPETAAKATKAWIQGLDKTNKLGCYAFPRNMKAPIHQFYLTDHVLIWRAIKSAEAMGLKHCLFVDRTTDQDVREVQSRKHRGKRYYWSSVIQGHILKRFTAENPVSKKRMLSVSRSPSHIRFLFRNKDAVLFQAMESGFFDKPGASATPNEDAWSNKLDIWKNLVDCQQLHEDNDETTWDEPLRFALSMIMAKRGKAMNTRSWKEMHARATSVLFDSIWPNDLFPGQLDFDGEPSIFRDEWKRDTYWGSTFEIPYILWTHAHLPDDPKTNVENTAAARKEPPSSSMPPLELDFWISLKTLMENQLAQNATHKVAVTGPMKVSFPWNNPVDQNNIVQLSDEWLYNEPGFFQNGRNEIDVHDMSQDSNTFSHSTIGNAYWGKYRPCPQVFGELEAVMSFNLKHKSYEKSFFEYTSAENNRWTTELHFSFYSSRQKKHYKDVFNKVAEHPAWDDLAMNKVTMGCRFDGDFFDRYWTVYFLESDPSLRNRNVNIESIVKNMLRNKREEGVMGFTTPDLDALGDNKEPWRQRRILELLLFQRIVDRMCHFSLEILQDAKSHTWQNERPDTTSGFGVFFAGAIAVPRRNLSFQNVRQRCQLYQRILQTVEQDLAENLAQIEIWVNRERQRQNEPPRWTFNDEIRYRTIISKLSIQNDHSIQELRRTHANMARFNEALTTELERLANEVDRRREDNIKRFTYVTVIFLPLSFGTGVFSMSDAPSRQTLERRRRTEEETRGATEAGRNAMELARV